MLDARCEHNGWRAKIQKAGTAERRRNTTRLKTLIIKATEHSEDDISTRPSVQQFSTGAELNKQFFLWSQGNWCSVKVLVRAQLCVCVCALERKPLHQQH